MVFEVADLAVASPATVSRCGMVYLEPSILGLQPFVYCWLRKLPDAIYPFKDQLQTLFDKFLEVRVTSIFNPSFASLKITLLGAEQVLTKF